MSMYCPDLLEKSYETSKIICSKLNDMFEKFGRFDINPIENFKNDGTLTLKNGTVLYIEYKQRQKPTVRAMLQSKFRFKKIWVFKSTADHEADIHFVYDDSLDCCQIIFKENIDKSHTVEQRVREKVALCYETDYDNTILVDFKNQLLIKNPLSKPTVIKL